MGHHMSCYCSTETSSSRFGGTDMDAYFGQISFMRIPLQGEGLCKFHSLVNSLGPNIMFQITTDMKSFSKYSFFPII